MLPPNAEWYGSAELRFLVVAALGVARMTWLGPQTALWWLVAVALDVSIVATAWWATGPLRAKYGEAFNARNRLEGFTLIPAMLGALALVYDVLHPVGWQWSH